MKKIYLFILVLLVLESCSGGMTMQQAASGRQKCGKGHIK